MIGIIFATLPEAQPFLEGAAARPEAESPIVTYTCSLTGAATDCVIKICGVGKVMAAAAAQDLIATWSVRAIVNAGICGAAAAGIEVGAVYRISAAREGDYETLSGSGDSYACASQPWQELPAARLITADRPVFDPGQKLAAAAGGELVDMEGAAVARVCRLHGVPCFLIKGVSDLADAGGQQALQDNLATVSAKVAEILLRGLRRAFADGFFAGEESGRETPAEIPADEPDPVAVPGPGQASPAAPAAEKSGVKADKSSPAADSLARKLLRFTKIEHTAFSLPLLFSGAWLGKSGHFPPVHILLLIVAAAVGARTFGMSLNRISDRKLDRLNPRTKGRELPQGTLSLAFAFMVAGAGLAVYLAACGLLGGMCLKLFWVPLAPLATYSLLKRFTKYCHFGIGLCLALAPLGAFVAATEAADFAGLWPGFRSGVAVLLLALFTFCWMSGADIIYALMDLESDRKTGVRSLPAALGAAGSQRIARGLHAVSLIAVAALVIFTGGGANAWAAAVVALAAFTLTHIKKIPVRLRFFPISAVAGVAGAFVPMLGQPL